MKYFTLGKRLMALYKLVVSGDYHFFDLCCDHGYLGIQVHLEKEPLSVTLNDQVPSICTRLSQVIADIPGSERINILNQDASKIKFEINQKKQIVIAGIGGLLAIKIIENMLPSLSEKDIIILSPHTKIHEVRHFLRERNFKLLEEIYCNESGQNYQMLKVSLNSAGEEVSLVGEKMWQQGGEDIECYYNELVDYYQLKNNKIDDPFIKLILRELIALKNKNN